MEKRKLLKFFILVIGFGFILVVSSGVVGFFSYKVGVYVGEENILKTPPPYLANSEKDEGEKVDFAIFWEVWRKLERKFLEKEKIDYQKMVYGAIDGMLKTLNDPYTNFFDPQQTKNFEEELSGKYEGVGMYVGKKDDQIIVISPLKGSPAERAGLKPEDKILKIEETETTDITIEKAVSLIKGPKGTQVRLLMQRKAWKEPKEFTLKRELIKIPTLDLELLASPGEAGGKEGNIALIKIYQFNQLLTADFSKAALEILNSKANKLILDLRNNPGGYLEVAQDIAGWFLEEGTVVVWQDSGTEGKEEYKANGPATFARYPLVVLINEGSASGAEILAGALKDQRSIKLIGEKSFGKGSVQEQLELSDGSSLKVTISRWLTPKGTSIAQEGLSPDVKVGISAEDEEAGKDPQLEKAIEIVNSLR